MSSSELPTEEASANDVVLLVVLLIATIYLAYRRFAPERAPRRTFIATDLVGESSSKSSSNSDSDSDSDSEEFTEDGNSKRGKKPRLAVFYGSQTGTAEEYARRVAAAGRHYKFKAKLIDMEDYEPGEQLSGETLAIFLVATAGEGEPTDNAVQFHEWLAAEKRKKGREIPEVSYTVFGLGNRTYKQFNAMGRFFDSRLEELGAERAFRYGEGDDEGTLDEDFCAWEKDLWPSLVERYGIDISDVGSLDDQELEYSFDIRFHDHNTPQGRAGLTLPEDKGIESKTLTHTGTVTKSRELHTDKSDRSCFHVEIDIGETSVSYEAGDHLAVYPRNDTHLVDEICAKVGGGVERSTVFQLVPTRRDAKRRFPIYCTIGTAMSYYVDLTCAAPARFIKGCSELASDPAEAERLKAAASTSTEGGRAVYQELVARPHRSVIEILEMFPSVDLPLVKFLELAPPLHPRYYSIASSARVHARSVHLCVALVDYTTAGGRYTKGVATHHLKSLSEGDRVVLSVRRSVFKLPSKASTPVVMVGPGTGLAPFMGFLQERRAMVASGKAKSSECGEMRLYFGCRRADTDFIYEEELKGFVDDGTTVLRTAFSREQEHKVYVQHLIKDDGAVLHDLIFNRGASLYVCGDAAGMAKDVDTAFKECLKTHGGMTETAAFDYIEQMANNGRYMQDVW